MSSNEKFCNLVDLVQRRLRDDADETDPELRVTPRAGNPQEERCAVCRDGPDGLVVCRGCHTLLHASCLMDVNGCPTIGCNERDPLQGETPKKCLVHDPWPGSEQVRKDLVDLWGIDLYKACTCEKKPARVRQFSKEDNKRMACGKTLESLYDDEMAVCDPKPKWEPLTSRVERFGDPDETVDFAHQKREDERRQRDKASGRRLKQHFWLAVCFVAFLLGLLHTILTSGGYIPS